MTNPTDTLFLIVGNAQEIPGILKALPSPQRIFLACPDAFHPAELGRRYKHTISPVRIGSNVPEDTPTIVTKSVTAKRLAEVVGSRSFRYVQT